MLYWLKQLALFILAGNNFWAGYLQLVSLATKCLDQHREMKLAATGDDKLVGRIAILNAHTDICLKLTVETCTQLTRRRKFSLTSGKWASINTEGHLQGWLGDRD